MDRAAENKFFISSTSLCCLLVSVFVLTANLAGAQAVPPLERIVTVSFYQEKPDEALSRLSKEAKFVFSYNPVVIEGSGAITGSFVNKSVREILTRILGENIQFKEKGNYIILTRTPGQQKPAVKPLVITGYVTDGATGSKIAEVSIYDKRTLAAAVTNEYGFFKLKVDKPANENFISVNKKNYKDTIMFIGGSGEKFVTVELFRERLSDVISLPEFSIGDSLLTSTDVPVVESVAPEPERKEPLSQSQINMENIRDTIYRDFQVSFVPFAGTNHKLSGNVISDYSFNVIGGYSLGTAIAEVGGVFNVDRGNVEKLQMGGVFNAVGGKMTGVQVAGVINMNNKQVEATQVSGTVNFNMSGIKGVQVGGVINMNAGESKGVQVAGVANIQVKDMEGSQIAGVINVATDSVTGSQIAGVVNIARKIKGTQIGVLNVADTIQGVPFGFLSFVRKGYHKIELSADEIFYANVAFRTGVRQFYNIFTAGVKPDNLGDPLWTVGYGVGTTPRLTKRLYLNFDLTSHHIEKGHFSRAMNLLNKLYLGVDVQPGKRFSITAGATLNAHLTEQDYTEYPELFTDYTPRIISDREIGNNSHLQMWWGAKIGIRFL